MRTKIIRILSTAKFLIPCVILIAAAQAYYKTPSIKMETQLIMDALKFLVGIGGGVIAIRYPIFTKELKDPNEINSNFVNQLVWIAILLVTYGVVAGQLHLPTQLSPQRRTIDLICIGIGMAFMMFSHRIHKNCATAQNPEKAGGKGK